MTTITATTKYTAEATTNYTLTANDLSVWSNIISMQILMGPFSTLDNATCLAFAKWNAYFTLNKRCDIVDVDGFQVKMNIPIYWLLSNTDLLQWMADLYTQLAQFQVPEYKAAYYEAFTAWVWRWLITDFSNLDAINVDGWGTAIMATIAKWNKGAPPQQNNPAPPENLDYCLDERAAAWSNAAQLQSVPTVLWTDQANALKKLAQSTELTSDQCLYLMYLLPSLATGTLDNQNSVQKIASVPCSSMELPNTNFYTSLVYYNLMLLADPMGAFTQTNPQILNIVKSLLSVIPGTDAGSVAMKEALDTQAKILSVSANYPMVDPYNSSTGFTTRQSDMLEAVNDTWASLQASL